MPLLGISGLVGQISKHIGPVTIVPMLILLCIGIVPDIQQKVSLHWISLFELLLLIVFVVILENYEVSIPYYSFEKREIAFVKVRLFGQFPVSPIVFFPTPFSHFPVSLWNRDSLVRLLAAHRFQLRAVGKFRSNWQQREHQCVSNHSLGSDPLPVRFRDPQSERSTGMWIHRFNCCCHDWKCWKLRYVKS